MGYKGKLFSEIRCGRCDWDYGNIFHVCVDKNDPIHRVVHEVKGHKKRDWTGRGTGISMSDAMKASWQRRHEARRPLYEQFKHDYMDRRMGMRKIAYKHGVGYNTVLNGLKFIGVEIRQPTKLEAKSA